MKDIQVDRREHENVSPTPLENFAMVNTQINERNNMCSTHEIHETSFDKWFHEEAPTHEYLTMYSTMRDHGVAPGPVRYLMEYAFKAGQQHPAAPRNIEFKPPAKLVMLCSDCGTYVLHERFEDPELGYDGYNCESCDEHTNLFLAAERAYRGVQ